MRRLQLRSDEGGLIGREIGCPRRACIHACRQGAGNFAGFRKHVIEPSAVRILAYLHISFAGIFAYSKTVMVGESEELRLMAPSEAVAVADANRDVIVGIKVRVGQRASG